MPCEPIRFLLVDDLEDNLIALEALLRRDGLVMDRARSAAEALELMLDNDYALALLDVHMPETDGFELAELMRGTERTRKVPIIFVTAASFDELRRFRGYEAGAVDYIVKPIDPMILQSKAEVFFRIGRQAQELARQRDEMRAMAGELSQAMNRLRAHADNSPLAFVELGRDLRICDWSQGAARMFGRSAREMVGQPADACGWISAAEAQELRAWLAVDRSCDRGASRRSLTMTLRHQDGREVHCECYGSLLGRGGELSLSLQFLDVTERHHAEQTRSLLIGELHHRMKNTLANVQAIARQSMKAAPDVASFVQTFTGRLGALSRAHSILSDATWAGAELRELIADQIRVGTIDRERLCLSGPPVELGSEQALRMALTLHELATNAAKYGALAVAGGLVRLEWHQEGEMLVFTWQEQGGPRVTRPAATGFGTRLIGAIAGQEGESAEIDWRPEGIVWTIRLRGSEGRAPRTETRKAAAQDAAPAGTGIAARAILVVEDEPLIAMDLVAELEDAGASIAGQARTVAEAMELIEVCNPDAVILDGNLRGERVDSVAAALAERAIPFCFVSGYGREYLPKGYDGVPIVEKPRQSGELLRALSTVLAGEATAPIPTLAPQRPEPARPA